MRSRLRNMLAAPIAAVTIVACSSGSADHRVDEADASSAITVGAIAVPSGGGSR